MLCSRLINFTSFRQWSRFALVRAQNYHILVKIPPIKQLLISVDFVVEQSDWGRSAAAARKQKRTITMDDGSIHRPLHGSAQRQPGGAKVNAQGVRPYGTLR